MARRPCARGGSEAGERSACRKDLPGPFCCQTASLIVDRSLDHEAEVEAVVVDDLVNIERRDGSARGMSEASRAPGERHRRADNARLRIDEVVVRVKIEVELIAIG